MHILASIINYNFENRALIQSHYSTGRERFSGKTDIHSNIARKYTKLFDCSDVKSE